MTYAATNEDKVYPLEKMLRILATLPSCYISAVLDCCRAEIKEATKKISEHRGGNTSDSDSKDLNSSRNLVLTFGCAPSDTTPAKSTISEQFFERLRKKADDATGEVFLPFALIGWRNTDGNSETLALTDVKCKLAFDKWQSRN